MATFAERLKTAIALRDTNQSKLAREAGMDRSMINHYIKGDYVASSANLFFLAKALNVSEAWLMGFDVPIERVENSTDARKSHYIQLFDQLTENDQLFVIDLMERMKK